MKKILSFLVLLAFACSLMAQTTTLTFTSRDANNHFIPLNRVVITNLTKGWQETIYYPDTTLTMQAGTSVEDYAAENAFLLSQNNPNPFNGTTDAMLTVVEPGDVSMEISDVNGRIVEMQNFASLQTGNYRFRIQVSAAGIYFMTARQKGKSSTIKMVNNGSSSENSIEFVGLENQSLALPQTKSSIKGATNNPFSFGDNMEYVGYATFNETEEESQHIVQVQSASENFTLQFDVAPSLDGQPCPNAPTLTDVDGNVYNTVQIGQQCWMKENLRTTKYADGTSIALGSSTSSTTAYRYYPNNDTNNVVNYGYLYNWKAVMRNSSSSSSNPSRVQGICPNGWHVPSNAEWVQLTGYVSSQNQYVCGDDNCHIAKALASTTGWNSCTDTCTVGNNPSTNNATGFSAVPAGNYSGSYYGFGSIAHFWTATRTYSSDSELAYNSIVYCRNGIVELPGLNTYFGTPVRCLRDNSDTTTTSFDGQPCPNAPTLTDVDGNIYNTVQIGQQCWMRENLRTTKYADGTSIALGSSTSSTTAYRYYPNNDTNNVVNYGYLYNWKAVMLNSSSSSSNPSRVQGICPNGWHVPSNAEWVQLTGYVSSQNQYVCGDDNCDIAKALASTTGWNSSTDTCTVGNNPSNNNATGFSAVPAGYFSYNSYHSFGNSVGFWISTQEDAFFLHNDEDVVILGSMNNRYGFSVRCIRD